MALTEIQRETLVTCWSEPHRRYHTIEHLTAVIAALDELATSGEVFEDEPVRLAAWFHDAVYELRAGDNEARSAEMAIAMLGPGPLTEEVVRLVLLTASHQVVSGDVNGAALCDADLAVLGRGPEKYQAYAAAVREEYAHVPEPLYRAGRAGVLRALLGHETIYHTAFGRQGWEAQARRNLTGELKALEA